MRARTWHSADGGIYEIVSPSGKRYIGSAAVFRERWHAHKARLCKGTHHCIALQRAWNRYGEAMMVFAIIEIIPNPTREALVTREQWYLDNTQNLYNTCKLARSRLGVAHPESVKKRIGKASKAALAKPEVRARMLEAMHRPERLERLAETGRNQTNRFEIASLTRGKPKIHSEETRRKIGDNQRPYLDNPENRESIVESQRMLGLVTTRRKCAKECLRLNAARHPLNARTRRAVPSSCTSGSMVNASAVRAHVRR